MSHFRDTPASTARFYAIRLEPGADVVDELRAFVAARGLRAVAVVTVVGSLTHAELRFANADHWTGVSGHFEIVSLVGTLEQGGEHLHISLADGDGRMVGGHFGPGSSVYTTAEIVLMELEDVGFSRAPCPRSGWDELVVSARNAG